MNPWEDPNLVEQFLQRNHLPSPEPKRAPTEGIVNAVWISGNLVVRINKDPDFEDDCHCEAIAHPEARKASHKTPAWVHFEPKAPEFQAPVSVLSLEPGKNLTAAQVPNLEAVYIEIARAIREFHQGVPPTLSGLDQPWTLNPKELIELDLPIASKLETLATAGAFQPPETKRFVHQDLHANNILIQNGHLSSILDWGDAANGDPACDLRYIPARYLESALKAYGDPSLAWRAKLHVLDQFLYCRANNRTYGPNADSTEAEVFALFT